ncbi:hypothetical protein E4U42_006348 [Claviceps africana]|uniref:Uncharacterized protein n=1 Tax=Claviceps africana TaxID=83212 RepID=A0A8K0NGS0_9HYPO|nr:hypothetical protein E4U42_006348 [Claviceps africana]
MEMGTGDVEQRFAYLAHHKLASMFLGQDQEVQSNGLDPDPDYFDDPLETFYGRAERVYNSYYENNKFAVFRRIRLEMLSQETLLITYGTMPIEDIRGRGFLSSIRSSSLSPESQLFVKYSDAVTWKFPIDEIRTNDGLMRSFLTLWPQRLEFLRGSEVVSGSEAISNTKFDEI